MCRARNAGQDEPRRCPSHSDPIQIAKRNERRRKTYQLTKVGSELSKYEFAPLSTPRTFSSTVEAAANESRKEMEQLSPGGYSAVRAFTTNEYQMINPAVYNGAAEKNHYMGQREVDRIHGTVALMDKAFSKIPLKTQVLYRGIDKEERKLKVDSQSASDAGYEVGEVFGVKGFQSTSADPAVAASYAGEKGGVIFEMVAVSGMNVTSLSAWQKETEVLLPRETHWKVVGVHEKANFVYKDEETGLPAKTQKTTVVQVIEVTADGEPVRKRSVPSAFPSKVQE